MDGDGADRDDLIGEIVRPVLDDAYDLVLASRTHGEREPGAKLSHQLVACQIAGFGGNAIEFWPRRAVLIPLIVKIWSIASSLPTQKWRQLGNRRTACDTRLRPSGPRIAHFDRIEWLTTPDPATQVAALQAGELDWVEQPLMDLVGRCAPILQG
jgi:hypothetical protein